jgi:NAD(P)-dependent dehydrogenase (short-subunit alcohol dehydrogenase family)
MTAALDGKSVAVVGASSGIGRGVAMRAIRSGADVVVAARRTDRLEETVRAAGGGRVVRCDLLADGAADALVKELQTWSTRLDVLFVSAGAAPLRRLASTSVEEWRRALDTNVIGINRLIAAALEVLDEQSVVAVVSSEVAVAPRSHLGAYGASKAALEHSIEQWREEHPWLRVMTISLGATVPTEFGNQFEIDETMDALKAWADAGRHQSAFMDNEEVCDVIVGAIELLLVAPTVSMPRLCLRSPSPTATDADAVRTSAAMSRQTT